MLTRLFSKHASAHRSLTKKLIGLCSNESKPSSRYFSDFQCEKMLTEPNPLRDVILQHIEQFGYMKMEQYWKLALTDSELGYYSKENVFSREGDFTTSPEISPLFGEMVAIWIATFLSKIGVLDADRTVSRKFRLVEMGPGRGYLMRDIVKALHELGVNPNFDICMVEVSEYNRKSQQDLIFKQLEKQDEFFRFEFESETKEVESFLNENELRATTVKWYQQFELLVQSDYEAQKKGEEVPLTIYLMNEYFDALPTSILEYTGPESGWRQKVVSVSEGFQHNASEAKSLSLKTSEVPLPEKMIPQVDNPEIGDQIEISRQSLLTMDTLAKLIQSNKGAVLNIDYGADYTFSNSIRAIKQHKIIPSPYFWSLPGQCDISAYVNFRALAEFAEKNPGVQAFEAVPQGFFLEAMGINPRIDVLQQKMNQEQKERIQSEYQRLTHPEQMGENFKVQCVTLKEYGQVYPWISEAKEGVY